MRHGIYMANGQQIPCIIIRRGSNNTRIELNGTQILVPTEHVQHVQIDDHKRIIPQVAMERLYRRARGVIGGFDRLKQLLGARRNGAKGAEFVGELFRRSIEVTKQYENHYEAFHGERENPWDLNDRFARDMVVKLQGGGEWSLSNSGTVLQFVDYEVFPFRTTLSCLESGEPATNAGAGGIDALFASVREETVLPCIGEIKARTETVGPTFALIQALMYSSQLLSRSQFARLKFAYGEPFARLVEQPRVDIAIIVEAPLDRQQDDLQFAKNLADHIRKVFNDYLRSILFVECDGQNLSAATVDVI